MEIPWNYITAAVIIYSGESFYLHKTHLHAFKIHAFKLNSVFLKAWQPLMDKENSSHAWNILFRNRKR